jgi:hypothetical protein
MPELVPLPVVIPPPVSSEGWFMALPGTPVKGLMPPEIGPDEVPTPKLGPELDCASRHPSVQAGARSWASAL